MIDRMRESHCKRSKQFYQGNVLTESQLAEENNRNQKARRLYAQVMRARIQSRNKQECSGKTFKDRWVVRIVKRPVTREGNGDSRKDDEGGIN